MNFIVQYVYLTLGRFGFSEVEYYTLFSYTCDGNESALASCGSSVVSCTTGDPLSAVAIDCTNKDVLNEVHICNSVDSVQ